MALNVSKQINGEKISFVSLNLAVPEEKQALLEVLKSYPNFKPWYSDKGYLAGTLRVPSTPENDRDLSLITIYVTEYAKYLKKEAYPMTFDEWIRKSYKLRRRFNKD